MRVLCVSENDYGNYSHNFSKALRSVGVDCWDLVNSLHPFGYESQSVRWDVPHMVSQMKVSDVVIVHHSHPVLFELAKNNCPGKVFVTHTGTRYREGHKELDLLFKDTPAITDQTEFFAINPDLHYIVSPVEFELAPVIRQKPIMIGHFPSNREVKGSDKIIEMLRPFKDKFHHNWAFKIVSHAEQLERMRDCDVYIELFKPELNGRPYGCFGVTALEAAAMGKIVITNNLYPEVYSNVYGRLPFTIANTEKVFTNAVNGLINLDLQMIRDMQRQTWEIMRENHSYKATGERILKVINESI